MAYEISLLTAMGISVLFALSLNLITGFCGQISLGHAAFLGVGAYTSALLCKAGVPFFATMPLAMLAAGLLGVVVGIASLRVRADFLAITTMGVVFLFVGVVRQQEWLGGELGVSGFPGSGLDKPAFMWLTLALAAATAALCIYIRKSWMGRVFNGIAEDEDTMRVLGIDVPRYKLAAFAIGTALAGLAGALYAQHFKFIGPDSFGFIESITVLSMVVFGGIGSVAGVVFGAAVLSALPAWFQFIGDYKLLVYGGLLFLMMRFSPTGVAGIVRRAFQRKASSAKPAVEGARAMTASTRFAASVRRHGPFRRPVRGQRCLVRSATGRTAGPDRPQRRRQDHADAIDHRRGAADRRQRAPSRGKAERPADPQADSKGPGAVATAGQAVSRNLGAGKRRAGGRRRAHPLAAEGADARLANASKMRSATRCWHGSASPTTPIRCPVSSRSAS